MAKGARPGTGGGATGGLDSADILGTTSLISQREGSREEVDQTMTVLRDVYERYGVDVTDAQLATIGGAGASVMAYYDSSGNLAINTKYFDAAKMDQAYDDCVKSKFHPPRGNKTGIEAVTEIGRAHV